MERPVWDANLGHFVIRGKATAVSLVLLRNGETAFVTGYEHGNLHTTKVDLAGLMTGRVRNITLPSTDPKFYGAYGLTADEWKPLAAAAINMLANGLLIARTRG